MISVTTNWRDGRAGVQYCTPQRLRREHADRVMNQWLDAQLRMTALSLLTGICLSLVVRPLPAGLSDDLLGRRVMLVAADVTFRTGSSPCSSVVENPTGGRLTLNVYAVDGDALRVKGGWVRQADVVLLENAVEFFSEQIRRRPTPFAYVSRSEAWRRHSQFDKALADAEEAVRLDPRLALAYCVRGDVDIILLGAAAGLQDFEKALKIEPTLPHALRGRELARRLLMDEFKLLTKRPSSTSLDKELAKLERDDARLTAMRLFEGAQQKGLNGGHRQAIADLEEAVRLMPELRTAAFFSVRGRQYVTSDDFEKAEADFREAISLEPENDEHYYWLGIVYERQRNLDDAISQFERVYEMRRSATAKAETPIEPSGAFRAVDDPVLDVRDKLEVIYIQRGYKRASCNDIAGAKSDFERAVRLCPKSSNAHTSRAMFLAQIGEYDQALSECDAAAANDPRSAFAFCSRGGVYLIKGDLPNALDTFNRAVALFPHDALPLVARAEAREKADDFRSALDDLSRAIAIDPQNGFWYAKRANIYRALNLGDKAAADTAAAQELLSRSPAPMPKR